MPRIPNGNWKTTTDTNHYCDSIAYQRMTLEVLLDIREELHTIRNVQNTLHVRLNCHETLAIPRLLKEIRKNTKKRKYVRKVKP